MRKLYSLIVAFVFVFFSVSVFAESINWQPYSKATFEEAAKQHKNVLIFGKVSWCHWCQKMRDEVLSNPGVISMINSNFIPVKVDVESNIEIAKKFTMDGFPTILILDANQAVVKRHSGFLPVKETINLLKSV